MAQAANDRPRSSHRARFEPFQPRTFITVRIADDQLRRAEEYLPLIIRYRDGAPIRLGDVAKVTDSVEDRYSSGFHNDRPAVVLMISRQPGANIIATIDAINAQLPSLRALLPTDSDLAIVMDRSPGIRATLRESEHTLMISAGLVMLVVFLFYLFIKQKAG